MIPFIEPGEVVPLKNTYHNRITLIQRPRSDGYLRRTDTPFLVGF